MAEILVKYQCVVCDTAVVTSHCKAYSKRILPGLYEFGAERDLRVENGMLLDIDKRKWFDELTLLSHMTKGLDGGYGAICCACLEKPGIKYLVEHCEIKFHNLPPQK